MKTAISIPDKLFDEAEHFARNNQLSRSELYAQALATYLEAHRREHITEALNRIYEKEDSRLDPALAVAQWRAIGIEDW
jgi:metal-responsive CopG/Arc/MetJ family transcriptional regulator